MDILSIDWKAALMEQFLVFGAVWGIMLFVGFLMFMDWLGRRKERKPRDRAA